MKGVDKYEKIFYNYSKEFIIDCNLCLFLSISSEYISTKASKRTKKIFKIIRSMIYLK